MGGRYIYIKGILWGEDIYIYKGGTVGGRYIYKGVLWGEDIYI